MELDEGEGLVLSAGSPAACAVFVDQLEFEARLFRVVNCALSAGVCFGLRVVIDFVFQIQIGFGSWRSLVPFDDAHVCSLCGFRGSVLSLWPCADRHGGGRFAVGASLRWVLRRPRRLQGCEVPASLGSRS